MEPGEPGLIVVDIFRIEGGRLAEHWDVLQADLSAASSAGAMSMFDPDEAQHHRLHMRD